MKQQRPVNLDLGTIKFPIMAIVSILHRISGIGLFLLLPVMLYFLDLSLIDAESFANLQQMMTNPYIKFILWAFSTALIYHLLAGFRHVMMDMGYCEHLSAGRNSAVLLIILTIILTIFLGFWIW